MSATSSEGLITCRSGAWASASQGSGTGLTTAQQNLLSALSTVKIFGSNCTADEKLSVDSDMNIMVCKAGKWAYNPAPVDVAPNSACSTAGKTAFDTSGYIMSCQSGTWRYNLISTVNSVGGSPNFCLRTETYSNNSTVLTALNVQLRCGTTSGGFGRLCDNSGFTPSCRAYAPPVRVTAGDRYACAIIQHNTTDGGGNAYCWGVGSNGRLGNNSTNHTMSTSGVYTTSNNCVSENCNFTDNNYTNINSGGNTTCGIKTNGSVWCWGNNSNGQFGLGSTSTTVTIPTQIPGTYKSISVGDARICGIRTNDTLWCAGSQRLGDGTTNSSTVFIQIGAGNTWRMVSNSNFGNTCAIRSDNSLWCWGASNGNGQLGVGDNTNRSSPTQVAVGSTWNYVEAGAYTSCGIRTNGTLWCWGANDRGQFGNGTQTGSITPVQVSSDTTWTKVEVGGPFGTQGIVCALRSNNTLWCAGNNDWGAIGVGLGGGGGTEEITTFTQVPGTWYDVTVGDQHNVCGVRLESNTNMRAVYCWGQNNDGQLGLGTSFNAGTSPQAYNTPQKTDDFWRKP